MRLRFLFTGVLACCLAISAAVKPVPVCRGDVNGDHLVNILDVQTLTASVLGGGVPSSEMDANRDGQVDVRDLQFILGRLNSRPSSELPSPSEEKTPCAVIVAANHFGARTDAGTVEIVNPSDDEARAALYFHAESRIVLSSHTERYLFSLTPNAPPFLA